MRKRELTVSVNKVGKEPNPETDENKRSVEEVADSILYRIEKIGVKVFLGLCIYVVLDTYRQTSIERVKREQPDQ